MTECRGQARKLDSRLERPVQYHLPLGEKRVALNPLLGQQLRLCFTGRIFCCHCGKLTNKSFNQGYCYRCFESLAQCDTCVMSPELCHYAQGTCREPVWGEHFCMQDHIVYFANSSGLKVGITRASQVPTRWIDQGATQALAVLRVRSRQQAGLCEAMFRQHVTDRTNWRNMLRGEQEAVDLCAERDRLLQECTVQIEDLRQRFGVHAVSVINGVDAVNISYPVERYPDKLVSLDFDKTPGIGGVLQGIKGQYLLLEQGVLNIRKYTGYELELIV
ncbi:MAG: DUF2797 domain-containing protein [Pseudomonadales bacterium]|jgi:hypothetical protein|nr:DUF2797 domain-containing protein [Pseudomonadales bacterium]